MTAQQRFMTQRFITQRFITLRLTPSLAKRSVRTLRLIGFLCSLSALCSISAMAASFTQQDQIDFIVEHDRNADHQVQHAEYWQRRQQWLAAMDRHQNAQVDLQGYQQAQFAEFEGFVDNDRQRQLKQTEVRFAALDSDQDGVISMAEYHASGARAFTRLDQHQDGVLDARDLTSTASRAVTDTSRRNSVSQRNSLQRRAALVMPTSHSVPGMLQMYDQNHDGKVREDEYKAIRQQVFARTDLDGNAMLSAQEYLAEFTDRLEQQIALSRQQAHAKWALEFAALDSDGNGILSTAEYHQAGAHRFALWDTNQDRVVSLQDKLPVSPPSSAGASN
jgi:Ca2+-binding EF-hand superfamily protein